MRNEYAAEIAQLTPCKPLYPGHVPNGWEMPEQRVGNGIMHCTMSDEGRAHFADLAVIFDQHVEALSKFMETFGQTRCIHNRPLTDLSWSINDYVRSEDGCSGLWPWFILWGSHDDLDTLVHQDAHADGWAFCMPYEYHAGIFMPTEYAA